jgi:hypothetical protein
MTNYFSENSHLTESTFEKKRHLAEKILLKVVWPKIHLTESSFDRKLFLKMIIWPKSHLTEDSFERKLFSKKWSLDRKVICTFFFDKLSFSKNCHLTDCSYSIRIVHVPNFFNLGNQTLFWSDADSKMRKTFPILMTIQGCFTFCQKLFRSNHSVKWTFGQINFQSNDLSVKWSFFEKSFRSFD